MKGAETRMAYSPPQRVIWITTDHMRYDGVGAYGNAVMRTPNLDQLAAHGVNFHNCFTQNPVCQPSRASFMTGLYPQQTGVTDNGYCLPDDFEPVVSRLFSAAGYQTAQIGKLHFQPHEDGDLDSRPRLTYGFDTFYLSEERGCYESAYMTWLRLEYPEHVNAFRLPRPTSFKRGEKKGWVVEAPRQASHAGWIVDAAMRHLRMRGRTRQFLHLGFHDPHPPLNPTHEAFAPYAKAEIPRPRFGKEEWADKPLPLSRMLQGRRDWSEQDFIEYRRFFYALTTQVDLALGDLFDYLRKNSLWDDTLIVFSSDHGDMCGDHNLTHKGPHFYDEVMHVPQIFHWPAGLGAARRDVPGLTEMVDVLPTIVELSGGHVPEVVMGRSLARELLAGQVPAGREDVFAFYQPSLAMLRTEDWKYIRFENAGTEVLYDLSQEPHEVANRAGDAACADVLTRMRMQLLSRMLRAGASRLPRKHCW